MALCKSDTWNVHAEVIKVKKKIISMSLSTIF